MKYRSNNHINLKGCTNSFTNISLNLYGFNTIKYKDYCSTDNYQEKKYFDYILNEYKENKDFSDLKNYITTTFIFPLINNRYDFLEENLFNIFYVLDSLESIKKNETDHKLLNEIEIYINIIKIFKTNITSKTYIKKVIERKKYGGNTLHMTTEQISLKREMEVYIALYDYPEKNDKGIYNFDREKLKNIKHILEENPGCYYQEIKKKLL